MKQTLVLSLAAMMLFCSFDWKTSLNKAATAADAITEATTVQNNEGQAAGKALKALYTQYKADGKFDYKNVNNITNTISLLKNCKNLKTNAKDKEYWANFASGLMNGSDKLVNESNSESVMNSLNSIMSNVDTSKLDSNNALQKAATVASSASGISSLLSMFK